MRSRAPEERTILAIDPTSRGIAFVVYEGGEMLDWGERGRQRRCTRDRDVVVELLRYFGAETLVLEDPDAADARRRPGAKQVLRSLAEHAAHLGIDVRCVARSDVRAAWRARGVTRKEAVAAAIAEMHPELARYVPPQRKAWMNEDWRVNLFDAASLVLHAFGD